MWAFFLLAVILRSASASGSDELAQEKRFLSNPRQLVFEGKRSGEGYFSPDGTKLIFQSEREPANPFYQQYIVLDLGDGRNDPGLAGIGQDDLRLFSTRDGTRPVCVDPCRSGGVGQTEGGAGISRERKATAIRVGLRSRPLIFFPRKQDGTDLVNLTHSPGYDAEGSFSPDGKQIVFCSLRGAFPLEKLPAAQRERYEKDPSWFGDIYIMNADGSNVRRLTSEAGYDGGPFFSPDGQRIVWRHFEENGMIADVWTMKLDGSDKRRVTDFKSMSWAPFYHPSGDYFIFTSNKLGFENFELFLVDAKGEHEPVRVTFTPGFDGLPVFSPDGKKLCWTSGRTGDGKVTIVSG